MHRLKCQQMQTVPLYAAQITLNPCIVTLLHHICTIIQCKATILWCDTPKSIVFVTPDQMLRIHRPRNPIRRFTTNIVYIILNSYTSLWHPIRFRFAPYTNSVHLHFTEYQKYAIISVYTPVISEYKYRHRMPTIQFWHRIDAPSRVLRTCLTTNTKTKARAPLVSIRLFNRICFV